MAETWKGSPEESAQAILRRIREIAPKEGEMIISGGRGIGSPDFFETLQVLADLSGGEIGSSRANVEAGWIKRRYQVGQTGRRVSPKIYLACGISGAPQHLVGIRTAEYVIAVNRHERAPIFERADMGVVGDVLEIIPEMIRILKEERLK